MYRGLTEAKNGRIIYLDMNSFFASVEQQYHPPWQGRPLAVVSHIARNGTVLAASYEAKAFGIGTGTKLYAAQERCPELLLTTTTPELYRQIHQQFMTILRDICGPEVIAYSIDEASIFLSPNWQGSSQAHQLALQIKERFRKELGPFIRCSIGIAPNTLLGKVASNLQKPDGLTEIRLETLLSTLEKLELTDLPGIAERAVLRLQNYNIYSPLDFYHIPLLQLQKWFGIWGSYWWYRLHGFEIEGPRTPTRSFSHEHVLTKWLTHLPDAAPLVAKMSDRLIHRLRRNELLCQGAWLKLSLETAPNLFAGRQFDAPTDSYLELQVIFRNLHQTLPSPLQGRIRKITLGLQGLSPKNGSLQLDLFAEAPRAEQLSKALEDIRARFGFTAISPATSMSSREEAAKEEIGFGRVKDRYT